MKVLARHGASPALVGVHTVKIPTVTSFDSLASCKLVVNVQYSVEIVNGFQGTCITFILFGTVREVWSLPCGYVAIIFWLILDAFPEGVRSMTLMTASHPDFPHRGNVLLRPPKVIKRDMNLIFNRNLQERRQVTEKEV
jgi:hypothetical protein